MLKALVRCAVTNVSTADWRATGGWHASSQTREVTKCLARRRSPGECGTQEVLSATWSVRELGNCMSQRPDFGGMREYPDIGTGTPRVP